MYSLYYDQKNPNTHIHPERKNISVKYSVEYTEKDEDIKQDFSNIKKVECLDLESMINLVFVLRQRNKYNINTYYIVEDQNGWIAEDSAHDLERYSASETELKKTKQVETLQETLKVIQTKLDACQNFLKKYQAEKRFLEETGIKL